MSDTIKSPSHSTEAAGPKFTERELQILGWAMQSLKRAMRWDEERFGREYDLDVFNIVAVSDFNMGAMENAGAVTLRDEYLPRSRQDAAFYEFRCSVILHEMAHMWFGDLVTMKWWEDS